MKKLAIGVLLTVAGIVSSCGTSTQQPTIQTGASGNWEARLSGGLGEASKLNFVIGFQVLNTNGQGSQSLAIDNFSFINSTACFPGFNVNGQNVSQGGASGSATLTTNNANQVTGTISVIVTSATGNTLTLTSNALSGTASNGSITSGAVTGTWTLTGGHGDPTCCQGDSSCPAGQQSTPSFILCQNATTCTITS